MPVHAASHDYDLAGLAADPPRLSPVVTYDRPWLGDLTGLDVVHLQCHIGTDTVSLARLGGRVTGVDFSPSALDGRARTLRVDCGADIAVRRVGAVRGARCARRRFRPRVHRRRARSTGCPTSPDGPGWSAGLLRPGGRLYVRDGHPMLRARSFDERIDDDVLRVTLPYFEGNALHWVSASAPTPTARRWRRPGSTSGTTGSARSCRP